MRKRRGIIYTHGYNGNMACRNGGGRKKKGMEREREGRGDREDSSTECVLT